MVRWLALEDTLDVGRMLDVPSIFWWRVAWTNEAGYGSGPFFARPAGSDFKASNKKYSHLFHGRGIVVMLQ